MKILVSALEVSSNIHLKALRLHLPGVEWLGVYEPINPQDKPLLSPKNFSVMGFKEVFGRLFFFYKALKAMAHLAKDADLVLLMDSSSFNIPLAKRIKKAHPNKPVLYYILPQVWAWKAYRAPIIERHCDKLAAILPFELSYYKDKARFVGHPLLDEIKHQKTKVGGESVVFMPGSRKQEIERIFPIFVQVAQKIGGKRVLVVPSSFQGQDLNALYGKDLKLFEVSFDAHKSLYEASFAFICSGTATLEAALIGTPFVLAYKARPLDFFIAKNLVHLTCIGLANIFYNALHNESPGRGQTMLHPEIIQDDFNATRLLHFYNTLDREKFLQESQKIRAYLQHGSAQVVAEWIKHGLNF
ncbi:lipid-A-disaccharide synthase [Helicobacter ailurogastricus]|uniref:Lipid-A-disaccharide synthase n=1 Tax=Helicobacter ailurogastricus TaxID=1578720 RepID=A0A0K2X6P1_9HELI|nr:lipid-A-disaccharide synthase [Helicobacter ailurogastricus]CRF41731.1 Lipid-A-disaccharide synthase [Helicobacter ailurogastricus]CRF42433.1 Lipid-A-disaccharide synthase [Helicobacter ailurogastricus]CRF43849.1 Lipid-A-disaccharide synthase [Helicobacter ailurogastricus]GLH58593.1 Lipid-A-disaccharide synthase LpxB [Helicobacter ailurogastricus]GLH59810.1 Lipid-A-disaccharide synthase LpxB [Helicobacter ailurogastricus]